MKQIVRINLENEMDLILAHKRTMKLAELCGLSMTTQTALATGVSEIARCALLYGKNSYLSLSIENLKGNLRQIAAVICDTSENCSTNTEAIGFAKRLIPEVKIIKNESGFNIQLTQDVKFSGLLTDIKIQSFVEYFKTEAPVSAYDEIRRKNIQLLELADKLHESENQYRLLTDTLPLMMLSLSPTGEIVYTNQWLKDYIGTNLLSINSLAWEVLVHADDYAFISKEWETSLKKRTIFTSQGRLKHKSTGEFLWHLISILPVKNDTGAVTHWIGFFVDINAQKTVEETLKDNVELKETQKKLVDYQQRLEEKIKELNLSNHELEQFAYIASHDLQEPLRKIITFSSLLGTRLKDIEPESRMYLDKIIASSKRMTTLINDVLDYSQVARSNEGFKITNLNEILETIKTDFEVLLEQKNAVIHNTGLPSVKGIPQQLTQLFSNLISNALKFCENNPVITISSREISGDETKQLRNLDQHASYIEISFMDNGIGFEQEYAEQIFTIFQRLNGRSEYSGTGIGLAICKRIAENHRGHIKADAALNQGATFKVYLPVSS